MIAYHLKMKLLSDTTFGRGDGVAGLIDQEVEHDSSGFPYLRGRTLKGLLSEECDNLIAILPDGQRGHWEQVACRLFGIPGSTLKTSALMQVGDACLAEDLRLAVAYQLKVARQLNRVDILESLTTIRRQTAIDPKTGTADENSLRSSRIVLRDLEFTAPLRFEKKPDNQTLALLAAGTLALRRVGSGRNRGRGHVHCYLLDSHEQEITGAYLHHFFEPMGETVP